MTNTKEMTADPSAFAIVLPRGMMAPFSRCADTCIKRCYAL
jgi:hypothetical protein